MPSGPHVRPLAPAVTFAVLALASACDPPPPTTVPTDCTHVDGRGGAGADGTAAHPYRSIDDAVAALGAAGGTICLPVGELDPPSATLTAPLVLRGASAADTHLSPPPGGSCLPVTGVTFIPPDPTLTQSSEALIETSASLTLEDLTLSDCAIGVRALGGDLVLRRVTITRVQAGVLAEPDATVATTDTLITTTVSTGTVTVPPGGVVSAGARSIRVGSGTDISGHGAAVHLWNVDADIVGAHLHDVPVGFLSGGNAPERMVRVMDTRVEHLRATAGGGGFNLVWGGSAMIDHLVVADADNFALALDGATSTILSSSFAGARQLLQAQGGTTTLMGTSTFTGGAFAIASTPSVLTSGSVAGSVHVMGPVTSTGASVGHAYVDQDAELVFEVAGSTLSGGPAGIGVFRGGHLEVRSGITIVDVDTALTAVDTGSTVAITGLVTAPRIVGVLVSDASVTVTDGTFTGGQHALVLRSGALTTSGGAVHDATSSGVRVLAGTAMLSGTTIDASMGPGLSAEGGTTTLDAVDVTNSGEPGAIADEGATLDVTGSTFDANVGAAIAVYDGTVSVAGSTFLPSRPATGGRIDHLRIVTEASASATMTLGDGNSFQLGGLSCPPDTCSVIMASGAGANAIVRPNCLTASDANLIQGLEQDGGTITGTTTWLTIRNSPGVLLAPGSFPGLPIVPPNPPVPMGALSAIGF